MASDGAQSIGDVAWLLGVSPGTIRLWESQGLVSPARGAAGKREYSTENVARLRRVKFLRSVQRLNAPAIRQILDQEQPTGSNNLPADRALGDRAVQASQLRTARRRRGFTLKEAAERTGLSVSFISSVERGTSGASPTAIARLMDTYQGGVVPTVDDSRIAIHQVGAGHAAAVSPGVEIEWLSSQSGLLEPQFYRVAPGASSVGTYEHKGEEFLFVLAGMFRITIGDETHELIRGSSLHFPSHLPHRWENPSQEEAQVVWISTERGLWRKGNRTSTSNDGHGPDEQRS